jgi:uncharacterized protein (DUF362 family)
MTSAAGRLYIEALQHDYPPPIRQALNWLGVQSSLRWGDSVFIKPNLTFPVYRRGVMTSPACVEGVVVALKDYTNRIVVGEADSGGYNRFSIDAVLLKTGMKDLERRYGIRVVNLSHLPYRCVEVQHRRHPVKVPLPVMLLDETDLFVTAAVPKIHMYTRMSAAVKNLWGCIPDPAIRMKLHPSLSSVLLGITRSLPPSLAVIDGKYGLNRCGPMEGDPVKLGWLMVADNPYAADLACSHLMQISPKSVCYLRYAARRAALPRMKDIDFSQDWRQFVRDRFYLRRRWTDYPGLLAFRSRLLAHIAYYSPVASLLHRILYLFRQPFYDYEAPDRTPM